MIKLVLTYVTLMIFLLTGCGGGNDAQVGIPTSNGETGTNTSTAGCPVGEFFSTNGMLDFISVGADNLFQMQRSGSSATGYVTCTENQTFVLTIESSIGNCTKENGCTTEQYPHTYYDVQDVGTYNCKYSIANRIVTVYCPGEKNQNSGNVFNPARTYLIN